MTTTETTILLRVRLAAYHANRLRDAFPQVRFVPCFTPEEMTAHIAAADAIIGGGEITLDSGAIRGGKSVSDAGVPRVHVRRFLAGEPLRNRVDTDAGY